MMCPQRSGLSEALGSPSDSGGAGAPTPVAMGSDEAWAERQQDQCVLGPRPTARLVVLCLSIQCAPR